MSKVLNFSTYLMINIIMGLEWCLFIGLYSAVELFKKCSKLFNKCSKMVI